MFTVIYSFQVKEGKQSQFEKAWLDMTKLIYEFEGSLGSRLHKKDALNYIAYAQWPSKETWKNTGDSLPDEVGIIRQNMHEACDKIETQHELLVVSDYIKNKVFK